MMTTKSLAKRRYNQKPIPEGIGFSVSSGICLTLYGIYSNMHLESAFVKILNYPFLYKP